MGGTHCHFVIYCYNRVDKETGNFLENTVVDLICTSTTEALDKAKQLIDKKKYYVHDIIEHIDGFSCNK